MTKAELIKMLKGYDDDTVIMVNGENCPIEVTDYEEGAVRTSKWVSQCIILIGEEENS